MNRSATIEHFLAEFKTIAVVGLSSRTTRAGYYVPAYVQEQGYCIIPVNPNLQQALDQLAYPDLLSIPRPVDLVLIFRRPQHAPSVVKRAVEIGAKAVWMQLGISHQEAAVTAREAGLDVVQDACIMVEHRRWSRQKRADDDLG